MRIFLNDGFIDRYSGRRLVFPGILRLLSTLIPNEFPFQSNWKMSECHIAYYELLPTIDHVIRVARGGLDQPSNWVTTAMQRNSVKSNGTLEKLGWTVLPGGKLDEWDGLTNLYISFVQADNTLLKDQYLRICYQAAVRGLAEIQRARAADADPIFNLGTDPITLYVTDASSNHDH